MYKEKKDEAYILLPGQSTGLTLLMKKILKEKKHKNICKSAPSFWKKIPTYFCSMQTNCFPGSVLGMFSAEETLTIIIVIVIIAE